jgi:hypothetical protein
MCFSHILPPRIYKIMYKDTVYVGVELDSNSRHFSRIGSNPMLRTKTGRICVFALILRGMVQHRSGDPA